MDRLSDFASMALTVPSARWPTIGDLVPGADAIAPPVDEVTVPADVAGVVEGRAVVAPAAAGRAVSRVTEARRWPP